MPAVRLQLAQDLRPPARRGLPSRRRRRLEAPSDPYGQVSRSFGQSLAELLVRRVQGPRRPEHGAHEQLSPAGHLLGPPFRWFRDVLSVCCTVLRAAEKGADAFREPGGGGGELDDPAAHPASDHGRRLVELVGDPGNVADGLVERTELAVYVVHRYVRLAKERHDLLGDLPYSLLGGREDPGEPQEHPRQHQKRHGEPRKERPLSQLYEYVQQTCQPPTVRPAIQPQLYIRRALFRPSRIGGVRRRYGPLR